MGLLSSLVVQDFVHQQYDGEMLRLEKMYYSSNHRYCLQVAVLGMEDPDGDGWPRGVKFLGFSCRCFGTENST